MPATAQSVKAIFDRIVELDPADRPAFLDQECGGDVEVRKRVEALLRYESAGSFLESPAPPPTGAFQPATTEQPGTIIGPFKLLQLLGEGGMGEVWMAEQEQPVKRRVALKIIKAGMDSARIIARFEAERQALALMDHPNIARVFEGGMVEAHGSQSVSSGRPYFVMELVKGIALTTYCDENHLTPKERLELFIPVCQAVQHAHQKGIIHRDLKPSNVLIALYDGKPVPKVIDFGVAKALHQNLTERTMFTEIGSIIGTLEYMSPEQAELNNLDIDTRSDIYSLGVILYELLNGSRPLDAQRLRSAAFADMLRIIREEEPEKPSTKLSHSGDRLPAISAQRKTEPRKLSKLIRGDLDWIVMKALEKDRARRYETANGFAMDVQRYLAEEPVLAGPPGATYRIRKFVRRNKAAVLATSLVLLALVAGMAGTYWGMLEARRERDRAMEARVEAEQQRQRAEEAKQLADRNFQKARSAVDHYLQKVADDPILTNRADLNDLRKQLLSAALPFFEEFVKEKSDDPTIRFSQANAHSRLAVLRRWLGDQEGGLRDVTKAQGLFSRLAAEFPDDPKYGCGFAVCLHDSAAFLDALGKQSEADPQVIQAIAILEKLVEQFPEFVPARSHLANSLNSRGNMLSNVGQLEQSLAAFRRAIAVQGKLAADFPSMENRSSLAMFQRNLGRGLTDQKKPADAELILHRSIQIQRQLIVEFPLVALHRQYLASSLCVLGLALRHQKRAAESEAAYREAVATLEKLASDVPSVPVYRHELVSYKNNLGIAQELSGRLSEAERTYRGCAEVGERLVADIPAIPAYRDSLAGTYVNIANLAVKRKEFAAALEGYGKGLALLEGVLAQDSRRATAREFARNAYIGRATTHRRMGRLGEALLDLEKAIAFDDGSMRAGLGWQHALTHAEAGNHAAAVAEAEKLAGESNGSEIGDYNTACVFARSSAAKSSDAKLSEEYAAQAVKLLRRAQAAGFFKDSRQVENVKKDTDLASLRNREDFRKLLAELEALKPPQEP